MDIDLSYLWSTFVVLQVKEGFEILQRVVEII